MKRKHLLLLIWYAIIIWGSLTPNKKLPNVQLFPHFDKIAHFVLYFSLTILLIPVNLNKTKYLRSYIIAFLISCFTGVIFEFLQFYTHAGRTASLYDAISNTVGAIFGIVVYQLFIREKNIEKIVFKIQ